MNEKEKMLTGELYDANYNKNLIKERYWVKDKCFDYNQLKPSKHEEKEKIIKEIFGKTGSVVTKDIPSNTVAVGNPCMVIKNIV